MAYILQWTNPALPGKGTSISVPVASIVSDKASIKFTGKGAANYGKVEQENLMWLLENFANGTEPANPTVGQNWYDTTSKVFKVCTSTTPVAWKAIGGIAFTDVGEPAPTTPDIGDLWFSRQGSSSAILYSYTGIGRYPQSGTTVGGWEQVWPTPQIAAGREEYDLLYSMLNSLVGATSAGGSGAIGRKFTGLADFTRLDASMRTKYNSTSPKDPRVLVPANVFTQPTSLSAWATTTTAASISGTKLNETAATAAHFIERNEALSATGPWAFSILAQPVEQVGVILMLSTAAATFRASFNLNTGAITSVTTGAAAEIITEASGYKRCVLRVANVTSTTSPVQRIQLWNGLADSYAGTAGNGINVFEMRLEYDDSAELKVDVNSQDWDQMLATSKYAVARLELPPTMYTDISSVPFVSDGRPAPSNLLSLPATDILYPSVDRRANRKIGSISLGRLYTETYNTLVAANANRYSIKGINGISGTNPVTGTVLGNNDMAVVSHAVFSGAQGGNTSGSATLRFAFGNQDERQRFLFSGGSIQVTIAHVPGGSGTAADTNFKSVVDQRGIVRVTADKIRTFVNSAPLQLATAPVSSGVIGSTGAALVSHTVSGATFTITSNISSTPVNSFDIGVTYNAGGAMNGTTTITFEVIKGTDTYLAAARQNLFPWSDNLTSWNSTLAGATVDENVVTAPDGTVTGDTLKESAVTNEHCSTRNITYTSTGAYTLSGYFKSGNRNAYLGLYSATNTYTVWYNLATGVTTTYGTSDAVTSSGMVSVGDGWWRCWFTANITSIGVPAGTARIGVVNPSGATNYAGDGTSGVYSWGRQLEKSSSVSSYVASDVLAIDLPAGNRTVFPGPSAYTSGQLTTTGASLTLVP